jgi:mono/diheme cytochrome c family protein
LSQDGTPSFRSSKLASRFSKRITVALIISPMVSLVTAHPRIVLGSALAGLVFATAVSGLTAGSSAPSAPATPAAANEVQFMRDVAPILAQRCISCHGPKEPEADLRLDTFEGMTKGEHPAVIPGDPEYSGIIQRVTEEDSSSRMPRDDDPLTPAQIEIIRNWIKAGAKFDGPDPKVPYATSPKSAAVGPASPHPVHPPATPEREKDAKAGKSEPAK